MGALMTLSGMSRDTGAALLGADHIRQSIADILTTPVGSRLCNRTYGSDLPNKVDAPLNEQGQQEIFAATAEAIARDYPQVVLTNVGLTQPEEGQITISITVQERGTASSAAPLTIDVSLSSPITPTVIIPAA